MNAITPNHDAVAPIMDDLGQRARKAFGALRRASKQQRTDALVAMADAVRAAKSDILAAGKSDLAVGRDKGLSDALLDRLALDSDRVEAIASAVDAIAQLNDQSVMFWTAGNDQMVCKSRECASRSV